MLRQEKKKKEITGYWVTKNGRKYFITDGKELTGARAYKASEKCKK